MIDYPKFLDIESTNICQIKCGMCPRTKMKRKQGFMKFDLLKKIVDESKGKVDRAYLHQIGEPLLHPDIIKFIDYTAEAGIFTSISTNCLELNYDMSEALLKSQLNELFLCVDSLNKEVYNKMRIGSNFHRVMWNVSNFLDMARHRNNKDLKIVIQLIKTRYNINEVDEWKKYYSKKIEGLNCELLAKEFSTFANNVEDIGFETIELRNRCGKVHSTMTINWDGTVVMCCRDYDHFTVLGNVNDNTITEIWHNDKYNE